MEKVKLVHRGIEIEIYDSISEKRLEDETREEYVQRRGVIKELEKARKRQKNWIHISSQLIPAQTQDGKILKDKATNNIMWIDKTKGITYIKKYDESNGETNGVHEENQESGLQD
jgi:hypothetical protein